MACESDAYTKRPREPNDPYTVLTDEQIRNIKKIPTTFFQFEPDPPNRDCKTGRCYPKRYGRVCSEGLVRDLERTCNAMYIDDQIRPHEIPRAHDYCRGMAAVKWGPMKLGERTRSHFFGEQIESFLNIDMYRRPATTYTGRMVMDCGRPGDGYYTQRFPSPFLCWHLSYSNLSIQTDDYADLILWTISPDRASWNCSSAPLNCNNVLNTIYRKTKADYKQVLDGEKNARMARRDEWPEYSSYTAGYLLKENLPEEKRGEFNFEATKKHARLGQRLQAEEFERLEQKRREKLHRRYCPQPPPSQRPVVRAVPTD